MFVYKLQNILYYAEQICKFHKNLDLAHKTRYTVASYADNHI